MKLRKTDGFPEAAFMTNALSRVVVVAATLAAFSSASAATIEVHSVAQLTAAVTSASADDTIRLMKDGSPYIFTGASVGMGNGGYQSKTPFLLKIDKDLVIEGEDDSPRSAWTDKAEPVIIDGNGVGGFAAIATGKYVTFKNITFTRGTSANNYTAPIYYNVSAVPSGTGYVVLTNCIFRQNTCASGYSATFGVTIRDCLVTNNTSTAIRACVMQGCDIVDSTAIPTSYSYADGCTFRNIRAGALGDSTTGIISNCTIEACSFNKYIANGGTFVNCNIRTNTITNANLADQYLVNSAMTVRGCTFEGNSLSTSYVQTILPPSYSCTNCTFIGNTCYYVAYNPANLVGCTFESNLGAGGGAAVHINSSVSAFFSGCTFSRNRGNWTGACGVAINMKRTSSNLCSLTVTNCTFEGNNAGGTGGAIYNDDSALPAGENPWDSCIVQDCTFTTNVAYGAAGVYGARAVKCTFDGNLRRGSAAGTGYGNAARKSYLEECDINDGDLYSCIADRCRIHDVPNQVWNLFREYTRATNCIVERCSLEEHGSLYAAPREAFDAEFVNCTIVSNSMNTYSAGSKAQTTNVLSFVNCLLNSNRNKYYVTDFEVYKAVSTYPDMLEHVTFSNTYYGKVDKYVATRGTMDFAKFSAKTNAPNALMRCEDPRFVGLDAKASEQYPVAPYWSLSLRSPILGRGGVADWMSDATDLAGRPRLNNGKVDPGCYQCWLTPPGLMMIVK